MFTVRNIVGVALMQVGVIVLGVLGIRNSRDGLGAPGWFFPAVDYGPISLVIPLLWIVIVLLWGRRPETTAKAKTGAFFSGVIILAILVILIGFAWLSPDPDLGAAGD